MVKKKNKGLLIVISGPSGAGKGTLCSEVIKNNSAINMSISMTSRELRGEEKEGQDYYFVTKEEFEKRIKNGSFLEYATYNGNYYGTPKDLVEKVLSKGEDIILEIDIQGALKINELMPEAIFVFIVPPTMKQLIDRLVKRNTESKDKIVERFRRAYQEINEVSKYNYVVINDEVDKATKKIEAIILAEKCRVDRIDDFELNNKEEIIHEFLLGEIDK